MNNSIAFFGGSVPAGIGFSEEKRSKFIYPNLIANHEFEVVNCSEPGSSNYEIFLSCCNFLANNYSDIIVVEWNTFHRWWFYPKFDFKLFISAAEVPTIDEKLRNELGLSDSDLRRFQKYLITLSSDYKSIIDLLDYCYVLQDYAKTKNIKIMMLNGNTPWTENIFQNPKNIKDIFLESDDFTKNVLDFENLNDNEILQWWSKIYQKYEKINLNNWMCFSENLSNFQIDSLPDGHPGPLSHEIYAEKLLYHIKEKL